MNGKPQTGGAIPLADDGLDHTVELMLARSKVQV
jgi:hypothetical protein